MPVPDNGIVQINAIGLLFGQTTVTTFFYEVIPTTPQPEGTDPALLAQYWYDGFGSAFEDALSNQWSWQFVECRDPRTPPVWASGIITVAGNGTVAQESCPPSVAQVITRTSGLAGRSYRGRIFLPAVPVDFQAEGKLTEGGYASLKALADLMPESLSGVIGGVNYELGARIWSRKLQASVTMTGATARYALRSQRRREIGVGI